MVKFLSSKVVWLGVVAAVLTGSLLLYMQGNYSPAIAATSSDSTASPEVEFTEGVHYLTIDPPIDASIIDANIIDTSVNDNSEAADKVTVSEFFWYGCPHCQYFEPLVEEWQKTFTDDLVFEQVPVVWNDMTQLHASIYYLGLESTDPVALHHKLFEEVIALRKERNPSAQLGKLGEVLMANGIESEAIEGKLNSPTIRERVARANKLMRAAQVSSTPTLVVDYRWVILNDQATSDAGIFNVANHLIERARTEK